MKLSVKIERAILASTVALAALAALFAGCGGGDDVKTDPKAVHSAVPAAGAQGAPAAQAGAASKDGGAPSPTSNLPPLPLREFQERDFAESDANRDPFRSFVADLVQQGKTHVVIQRKVLVERYALEELKLVGIVLGAPSRALLTDPTGLGWIAKVGDFVGKPELVHSGGPSGTDVPINWRVDRIRQSDVVFIREDPSHPEIPPTNRVIALRTVEENTRASTTTSNP